MKRAEHGPKGVFFFSKLFNGVLKGEQEEGVTDKEVGMMDKILGSIFQGTPTAIVVGILVLWFLYPIDTKVDRVIDVINREVIPIINELKREKIQGPKLQPISAQLEALRAELKTKLDKLEKNIDSVKQFAAVASGLGPALPASAKGKFEKGQILPFTWAGLQNVRYGFKVTNPRTLNKISSDVDKTFEKAGIKVILLKGGEIIPQFTQ